MWRGRTGPQWTPWAMAQPMGEGTILANPGTGATARRPAGVTASHKTVSQISAGLPTLLSRGDGQPGDVQPGDGANGSSCTGNAGCGAEERCLTKPVWGPDSERGRVRCPGGPRPVPADLHRSRNLFGRSPLLPGHHAQCGLLLGRRRDRAPLLRECRCFGRRQLPMIPRGATPPAWIEPGDPSRPIPVENLPSVIGVSAGVGGGVSETGHGFSTCKPDPRRLPRNRFCAPPRSRLWAVANPDEEYSGFPPSREGEQGHSRRSDLTWVRCPRCPGEVTQVPPEGRGSPR